MNPERWRRIEEIVNAALEVEPARREAFVRQSCAGDEPLLREVERLLRHQTEAEGFIESPAIGAAARELARDGAAGVAEIPSKKDAFAENSQAPDSPDPGSKPHRRAPCWMYAITAVFLVCAGVRYYACLVTSNLGPGFAGHPVLNKNRLPAGIIIDAVTPGTPAAKAGFKPGDILLLSNAGRFFPTPDHPKAGPYYWQSGRTFRIEVKRMDEIKVVPLTFERMPLKDWIILTNARPALASILISLIELALAVTIAFRRPRDPAACWGALFLAVMAIIILYGINVVYGWYSTILSLPGIVGWIAVLLPNLCEACFASIGISFATVFPRRLFQRRWIWALVWIPAVIFFPIAVFVDHPPLYSFPQWWPAWYLPVLSLLGIVSWGAVAGVFILNYVRLRDQNERRRVRTVIAGAAVTITGYVPIVVAHLFPNSVLVVRFLGKPYNLLLILSALGCALPVSMAYAILRHRIFDIRIMIRLGLRYAAARGALLSLVPIVVGIMAADLTFHRSERLVEIAGQRGLIYAVLAVAGILLHIRRKSWINAIDRHFFRERYDAHRVLRGVLGEIRAARSLEKVAPNVTTQIESAMHSEFAAVLIRRTGELEYRVIAAQQNPPRPIPANSKLMEIVRVLGKPLEIPSDRTGWPWDQLPNDEREFLRRSRTEWLFPINLAEGRLEALLAMGPKKSEEPYSKEDQELLEGITSSLALLLEQTPAMVSVSGGFEECPQCGTCYDSGSGQCKKEGATLTPLSFPRMLSNRYRFEQRLGKGGMGIVYEAFDTELERKVAVKLIHPNLTESAEASARFKQEAKAAASLAHPNVVTVHDFGIAEDQRAYLVMELLQGSSLRHELHQEGRLPGTRASGILRGVCAAVDAAHAKRLLHRDLKPENIFLSNSANGEIAKILDFGVVKKIAGTDAIQTMSQTGPGMLLGTLSYMSPEELQGGQAARSWDIWALAIVAYEMLAGAHPFAGSTPPSVYDAIRSGRITPLQMHLPETPASLQSFFSRALALDPELRPNCALELFNEFNQSIAGIQITGD